MSLNACASSAERKSSNGAPCVICRYRLPDEPKLTSGGTPPAVAHVCINSGNTWRRLAAEATIGGPAAAAAPASMSTDATARQARYFALGIIGVEIHPCVG